MNKNHHLSGNWLISKQKRGAALLWVELNSQILSYTLFNASKKNCWSINK